MHWIRRKVRPMDLAKALASMVFPTPGTPSTSTWPWEKRAATPSFTASVWPTMTFSTLATMAAPRSEAVWRSFCVTPHLRVSDWLP